MHRLAVAHLLPSHVNFNLSTVMQQLARQALFFLSHILLSFFGPSIALVFFSVTKGRTCKECLVALSTNHYCTVTPHTDQS